MAWWMLYIALTVVGWGIYNVLFKVVGNNLNYFLALLIIGIVQIIISLPFIISSAASGTLLISSKGYLYAALMGILVSIGTIAFFYALQAGAPVSSGIATFTIGALLIGVFAGIVIFHEALTLQMAIGIVFGIISIILLTLK